MKTQCGHSLESVLGATGSAAACALPWVPASRALTQRHSRKHLSRVVINQVPLPSRGTWQSLVTFLAITLGWEGAAAT